MENLRPVVAVQDGDSHWYIIPVEMKQDFFAELEAGEQDEWDIFTEKFSAYMTGGDLNNVQLYANI